MTRHRIKLTPTGIFADTEFSVYITPRPDGGNTWSQHGMLLALLTALRRELKESNGLQKESNRLQQQQNEWLCRLVQGTEKTDRRTVRHNREVLRRQLAVLAHINSVHESLIKRLPINE